jgi:hypothetical protein
MWKSVFDFLFQITSVLRDVKENQEQISKLSSRLEKTNEVVRDLAHKIDLLEQQGAHEREKLRLQLENALLHFEKRLPPPPRKKG